MLKVHWQEVCMVTVSHNAVLFLDDLAVALGKTVDCIVFSVTEHKAPQLFNLLPQPQEQQTEPADVNQPDCRRLQYLRR